jgi:hypothetical protein
MYPSRTRRSTTSPIISRERYSGRGGGSSLERRPGAPVGRREHAVSPRRTARSYRVRSCRRLLIAPTAVDELLRQEAEADDAAVRSSVVSETRLWPASCGSSNTSSTHSPAPTTPTSRRPLTCRNRRSGPSRSRTAALMLLRAAATGPPRRSARARRGAGGESSRTPPRASGPVPRGGVDERTVEFWTWALSHALEHLAVVPVSQLSAERIDAYRTAKLRERDVLLEKLRVWQTADPDQRGSRPPRPLGKGSINRTLRVLAQVLDDAVEYGHLGSNPARGRKRRLKASRPRRTWLEPRRSVRDPGRGR